MYLYRDLNCSLFRRVFFHIFTDFLSLDLQAIQPHNIIVQTNQVLISHTEYVTWLNSAEWTVLVGSPATCHMYHTLKGGPLAAHALTRWVQMEDRKDIPEFFCIFFTWFISREVASLNWFVPCLLSLASPCWTLQLGIHHRHTAVEQAWQQWCSCAHGWRSPLCFLFP